MVMVSVGQDDVANLRDLGVEVGGSKGLLKDGYIGIPPFSCVYKNEWSSLSHKISVRS